MYGKDGTVVSSWTRRTADGVPSCRRDNWSEMRKGEIENCNYYFVSK